MSRRAAAETLPPTNYVAKSLAGRFLVDFCSTKEGGTWSLMPLPSLESTASSCSFSSWQALMQENNRPASLVAAAVLHIRTTTNTVHLTWSGHAEANMDSALGAILESVAAQWAAEQCGTSPTNRKQPQEWCLVRPNGTQESFHVGENEPQTLFQDELAKLGGAVEWVEMVDQTGRPLGCVPRPLVHTHNLLHRGIGLFVTKDRPLQGNDDGHGYADVYVHQRTPTKRIFPSLYDMFVGGVSGAGEASLVTAQREVAEELGLKEPSHLSTSPLLTCVVCTSYNRCVVDLWIYVMDTTREEVSWQSEEVAWGAFCPYAVVEAAADRSIERLYAQTAWPGGTPPVQSPRGGNLTPSDTIGVGKDQSEAWKEWDFVPDGLLVWEAWLQWLEKQ
jgi:8-oxo-dGTP pyrophosphatase MutT (NUDIX family)